jgi:hypothetical protein
MNRISDETLILYYYGEAEDADAIAAQIEESSELRQRYAVLSLVLDSVEAEPVAERPAVYGRRVWHRIAPQIDGSGRRSRGWSWLQPRREWAVAAVLAVLLIAAFLAGRMVPEAPAPTVAGLSHEGRDRILLMTVAGHLERSEMLLLELVNTPSNGDVDLSIERQLAGELGEESRLYRQAARRAGKADVAALLEQLETVLVELSNAPETVPSADLGELRLRLAEGDVLFRVRVVGSRLRRELGTADRSGSDPAAAVDL